MDCTDGFAEAFYGRPERFLDLAVRSAQSGWGFLQAGSEQHIVRALARDLDTGARAHDTHVDTGETIPPSRSSPTSSLSFDPGAQAWLERCADARLSGVACLQHAELAYLKRFLGDGL